MSNIEDAIKRCKEIISKCDDCKFATCEQCEINWTDIQAIKIVLGNLEALCDMQRSADRELENAKKVNEEHKKENGELREKVKELEAKLEFKKYGDLDEIEFEEYMSHFIPKQKVKDVLQNNRNEIFSFTYVDDEQFKPYTMQIDRINKIEKELLEEGE